MVIVIPRLFIESTNGWMKAKTSWTDLFGISTLTLKLKLVALLRITLLKAVPPFSVTSLPQKKKTLIPSQNFCKETFAELNWRLDLVTVIGGYALITAEVTIP